MFVETLEAIETAKKGFDILKALNPYISKIWRKYRAEGTKVIIFGPGGVGKSTLGEIFTSDKEVIKDSIKGQYNQSDTVEKFYSDKSNIPFTLINPPGQASRAYAWDEIFRDISAGKIKGIIHVVSYGYHAIRELSPAQLGNWYSPGMSQDDFSENYVNYFGKTIFRKDYFKINFLCIYLADELDMINRFTFKVTYLSNYIAYIFDK